MSIVAEPRSVSVGASDDACSLDCFDFLGVPLANLNQSGLVHWVIDRAMGYTGAVAYAINAHSVNLASKNPLYRQALRNASAVYCDGISVLMGARFLGYPLKEKVTTTDVLGPICERAAALGLSMYILGNPPGVAEEAGKRLEAQFKGLDVCGTHSGFFADNEEEERVVQEIQRLKPRILWVGMGNPIQELWVERFRDRLGVPVILTCGGMMEIVAGRLGRPPQWWTDHGGEWLYRLLTQPRRTWKRYVLGNPLFIARLIRYRISG